MIPEIPQYLLLVFYAWLSVTPITDIDYILLSLRRYFITQITSLQFGMFDERTWRTTSFAFAIPSQHEWTWRCMVALCRQSWFFNSTRLWDAVTDNGDCWIWNGRKIVQVFWNVSETWSSSPAPIWSLSTSSACWFCITTCFIVLLMMLMILICNSRSVWYYCLLAFRSPVRDRWDKLFLVTVGGLLDSVARQERMRSWTRWVNAKRWNAMFVFF